MNRLTRSVLLLASAVVAPLRGLAPQNGPRPAQGEALERLRAQLAQPGPDGREARESAIETLFGLQEVSAHAVLQAALLNGDDRDGVRASILQSFARRLRNAVDPVFGEGRIDPA